MSVVDDRTPIRNWPKPHETNNLSDDVLRLKAALDAVDSDVAAIILALAGKAATLHSHELTDIIGLATALAGKAALNHDHAFDDLTDVTVAGATNGQFLKRIAGFWQPAGLVISDVANLQSAIDAQRPISNITELQAALDGKAALKGSALVVPRGPTSGRPSATTADALFRRNTETGQFEAWDGADWQGFNPFNPAAYLPKSGNLDGLANPDTAIGNLGGNANGRDILKNASTIGATVAKAADAAAVRAAIGVAAHDFVQGLTLSNNALDAVNDIDIAVGAAQLGTAYVASASTLAKRLDAAWAAGNNAGGLDKDSKANSSTYHLWALRKTSDGSFDALFSLSATAPTVPSGYVAVQRLGAILTDGSGAIRPFFQDGNETTLRVAAGLSAYSGTTDRATALLTCPLPGGIRVLGLFTGMLRAGASGDPSTNGRMLLADGNDINAATEVIQDGIVSGSGTAVQTIFSMDRKCRTDLSSRVYLGIRYANGFTSTLVVRGWVDESIPRI